MTNLIKNLTPFAFQYENDGLEILAIDTYGVEYMLKDGLSAREIWGIVNIKGFWADYNEFEYDPKGFVRENIEDICWHICQREGIKWVGVDYNCFPDVVLTKIGSEAISA